MSGTTTQQLDVLDQVYLITDNPMLKFLGHTEESVYEILEIFFENAIITGKNPYTTHFSQVKLSELRLYKKFKCENIPTVKEAYKDTIEILSKNDYGSGSVYVGD